MSRSHKMRLRHADGADTTWLRNTIDQASCGFKTGVDMDPDGLLGVRQD
jgi:hypothetical protein